MDTPRFVTHPTPNILVLKTPTDGCMTANGAIFFSVGLALLVFMFRVLLNPQQAEAPLWQILLGMCGFIAFSFVVTCLGWLRMWYIFDRSAGTLTERWGLLVAWQTKAPEDLTPFTGVRLTIKQDDEKDWGDSYYITLTGVDVERVLSFPFTSYDVSALAATLSQFLNLPLERVTESGTIQRRP